MNKDIKVGFVGLGKLGLDAAEVFADHYTTYGYDVSPRTSDTVQVLDTLAGVVEKSDWIFIAAPTPHDEEYGGGVPSCHLAPKDFNYDTVKSILEEINTLATSEKNIVLISTVLPGTTRRQFQPLLTNHNLIYNPYLIAMGTVKWDMVNPEMLIIGSENADDQRVTELISIYDAFMENSPRAEVGTWEEAEGIKIFYNTYISAKIGIVNMIQDFAMKIGHMNSEVVAGALARSTMRLQSPQYMVPGMGDSGACHPRDNIALRWLAEEYKVGYDMFDTIMKAREVQAENMAVFIVKEAVKADLPIVIHGKAYKPDVEFTIGSYSTLVGHYINALGHKVLYADPLTEDTPTLAPMKAVVLLAHSKEVTYAYTGSTDTTPFYFDILEGSTLIDPWRRTNKNMTTYNVVHYGDTRG